MDGAALEGCFLRTRETRAYLRECRPKFTLMAMEGTECTVVEVSVSACME